MLKLFKSKASYRCINLTGDTSNEILFNYIQKRENISR